MLCKVDDARIAAKFECNVCCIILQPLTGLTTVRRYFTGTSWVASSSTATTPSSGDLFEVFKFNNQWWFTHDYGTTYKHASGTWIPELIQVLGEVHDYSSSTEEGDHFPGDTSTKISANDSQKNISGTWSDTSLTAVVVPSSSPVGDADLINSYLFTDGVRIWDTRCSS